MRGRGQILGKCPEREVISSAGFGVFSEPQIPLDFQWHPFAEAREAPGSRRGLFCPGNCILYTICLFFSIPLKTRRCKRKKEIAVVFTKTALLFCSSRQT
jgi:hypothetical protein